MRTWLLEERAVFRRARRGNVATVSNLTNKTFGRARANTTPLSEAIESFPVARHDLSEKTKTRLPQEPHGARTVARCCHALRPHEAKRGPILCGEGNRWSEAPDPVRRPTRGRDAQVVRRVADLRALASGPVSANPRISHPSARCNDFCVQVRKRDGRGLLLANRAAFDMATRTSGDGAARVNGVRWPTARRQVRGTAARQWSEESVRPRFARFRRNSPLIPTWESKGQWSVAGRRRRICRIYGHAATRTSVQSSSVIADDAELSGGRRRPSIWRNCVSPRALRSPISEGGGVRANWY